MGQFPQSTSIAGHLLPLERAEELIGTLQSVVSARIVPRDDIGGIDAIHVLVTGELTPKQVVRNVESALMAHLGMRVDHRKISVAVTSGERQSPVSNVAVEEEVTPDTREAPQGRQLYFEDVEIRGSRTKGSTCRVTLRTGDMEWVGEADGIESSQSRVELAARAAVAAIKQYQGNRRHWEVRGVRRVDAFDASFAFVVVETWIGREKVLLTGTCEIRESAETASVLAVLDATNRWVGQEH
jgi:hypothetical protein